MFHSPKSDSNHRKPVNLYVTTLVVSHVFDVLTPFTTILSFRTNNETHCVSCGSFLITAALQLIMAMNEAPTCHKRNNSGKHQWTALQLVGRWKGETRGIGVMRERVNGGVRIVRVHWNRMGFGELWWRFIDGPVNEDTSSFVEMDRWCSNGAWEEVICWWVDHVGCEWWMNGRWTQCLSGLGLEWEEWDDHGRF